LTNTTLAKRRETLRKLIARFDTTCPVSEAFSDAEKLLAVPGAGLSQFRSSAGLSAPAFRFGLPSNSDVAGRPRLPWCRLRTRALQQTHFRFAHHFEVVSQQLPPR